MGSDNRSSFWTQLSAYLDNLERQEALKRLAQRDAGNGGQAVGYFLKGNSNGGKTN